PAVVLSFEGQAGPTVEVSPMPAFFVAGKRGVGAESSIEIVNHESEPLRIEKIEADSERFKAKLETLEAGQRYRLTLALNPYGPGGKNSELILIQTSSKTNPSLKIIANTYLRHRVYTFPDSVHLGSLPKSALQLATQTLIVY